MKLETIFRKLFPVRYEVEALRLQIAHMQGECAGMRMNLETSIKQLHRIETTLVNSQKVALERDISINTQLAEIRSWVARDKTENTAEKAAQVVQGRGWEAHRERIKPHVEKQYEEAEAARRTPRIPVGPDAGSGGAPDVARAKAYQAGLPKVSGPRDSAAHERILEKSAAEDYPGAAYNIGYGMANGFKEGRLASDGAVYLVRQVPDDGAREEGASEPGKEPDLPPHPHNG